MWPKRVRPRDTDGPRGDRAHAFTTGLQKTTGAAIRAGFHGVALLGLCVAQTVLYIGGRGTF